MGVCVCVWVGGWFGFRCLFLNRYTPIRAFAYRFG